MRPESKTIFRCAVYTRKSTERGLELEFNSLDAQREACQAYIKSQAHEGWNFCRAYDDPAFSGGSLDRPALKRLLSDIDEGQIDIVVVYKIDRLTRSLADFAKLVELFDKKSVSFVAVTQQFSTTSSMGRLTLNVLLSFAQFERELSSERVRDKVAASRKKGKWTGGTVPLGYQIKDKKLIVQEEEAKKVQHIFSRYLELKNLRLLIEDLNLKNVLTKGKTIPGKQHPNGLQFRQGGVAYLLKNRIYVGEVSYQNEWFPGEHSSIIEPKIFDEVQNVLRTNSIIRKMKRSESGALLGGLIFDSRGNRMSPSFTTKKGVRYYFYVSSAILRGRKNEAGLPARVSAPTIESKIISEMRRRFSLELLSDTALVRNNIVRIALSKEAIRITLRAGVSKQSDFMIPWQMPFGSDSRMEGIGESRPDHESPTLVRAIARAHLWMKWLESGTYSSIEDLAAAVDMHPRFVREILRFNFIAPNITSAILYGTQPLSLNVATLGKSLVLSWAEQTKKCGLR